MLAHSAKFRRHFVFAFQLVLVELVLASSSMGLSPFRFRSFPAMAAAPDRPMSLTDETSVDGFDNGFRVYDKRSYVDLRCRGMYAPRIFAQLDRVCEDCYNLYRDPEVHNMCRDGCFTTTTFQNCLRNLLLDKESEFYQELVDIIGKKR